MRSYLTKYARELRQNSTIAERKLWQFLRARNLLGFKFRRQEILGRFIVDFVCYEKKLIVELDGGQHNLNRGKDIPREEWLEKQGFKIIRFWNNEVVCNIDGVLQVIRENCES